MCTGYNEVVCAYPKAAGRLAYKGAKPSPTRKGLTDVYHES